MPEPLLMPLLSIRVVFENQRVLTQISLLGSLPITVSAAELGAGIFACARHFWRGLVSLAAPFIPRR
jgi:hypothetical protein